MFFIFGPLKGTKAIAVLPQSKAYVKIKTSPIYEIRGHYLAVPLYVHGYHFQISISITNLGPTKFNGGAIFVHVFFAFGQFREEIHADVEPIDVGKTIEVNLKGQDKWGVLAQGHALFVVELGEKTSTTQSILTPCDKIEFEQKIFGIQYKSIPICNKDSKVLEKQENGYHIHSFYSLSRGESYTLTALYVSISSIFILNYDKIIGLFKIIIGLVH